MAGKFEVYTDGSGKYRFRLKAANGEIIAVGEAYESKLACSAASTRSSGTRRTPRSST